MKNKPSQNGFTIVELMIATTIFSLVLMLCLAGILQITKMYYRAVTQNKTRETARQVIDEISEAIRFSAQPVQIGSAVSGPQINDFSSQDTGYFCVGPKRYSFAIDRRLVAEPVQNTKQKKHVIWVDTPDSCTGSADLNMDIPSANGRELLSENMRLYNFSLENIDPEKKQYKISIGVAYGDDDLLFPRPDDSPYELTCEGAFIGAEFCATTSFNVTVEKRL